MLKDLTRRDIEELLELVDDRRAEVRCGNARVSPGIDRDELESFYTDLYEKLNDPYDANETRSSVVPTQRLRQGSERPLQFTD